MSEYRPQGSNGTAGREARTPAEREAARTRKVTPETSVLRNDPQAAERQERLAEHRQERGGGEHEDTGGRRHSFDARRDSDYRDGGEAHGRRGNGDYGSGSEHRDERLHGEQWHADERRRGFEAPGRAQPSVGTLLRDLASDAADLVRKELALARNEISYAVSELKTGIIGMAAGGGVLFAGFLFLLLAATLGLANVMPGWAAALIVGGVVALIGLIMVITGQRRMRADHFRPDRTVEAMRKDREMLERRVQ